METDELLMDLVDATLARTGRDREAAYQEVRERYPDLYAEVKERVEWEERMGSFLCEPVMNSAPVRASHRDWALAGVLVVIATLAFCFWSGREGATTRPELLIILPGPPGSFGTGEEVAERLDLIGPSEALRQGAESPELARSMLGVKHAVRATVNPNELIKDIRNELHLRTGVPGPPTNRAAYGDYVEGLALLHADPPRREAAAARFRRAMELDPRSTAARTRLDLAEGKHPHGDAVTTYSNAIAAHPNYYAPYAALGAVYLDQGEPAHAEQVYRHAVALAPGAAEAHRGLGIALLQQRRYAEAEGALLASLGLKRSRETLRHLGELYAAEGRSSDASRFFEEAGAP